MKMLLLDPGQQAALAALNATGDPGRQLRPVPAGEGQAALNSDLLGDCAPGQTWAHYAPLLQTFALAAVELAPSQAI